MIEYSVIKQGVCVSIPVYWFEVNDIVVRGRKLTWSAEFGDGCRCGGWMMFAGMRENLVRQEELWPLLMSKRRW